MQNKPLSQTNVVNAILALARHWHKSNHQDPSIDREIPAPHRRHDQKPRYYLGKKFPNVYFTAQEAKYIYYALKGFSNKKTAQLLKLSPRTLTYYCDNIRKRIPCKNRKALIKIIVHTDFMGYLPEIEKLLGISV